MYRLTDYTTKMLQPSTQGKNPSKMYATGQLTYKLFRLGL